MAVCDTCAGLKQTSFVLAASAPGKPSVSVIARALASSLRRQADGAGQVDEQQAVKLIEVLVPVGGGGRLRPLDANRQHRVFRPPAHGCADLDLRANARGVLEPEIEQLFEHCGVDVEIEGLGGLAQMNALEARQVRPLGKRLAGGSCQVDALRRRGRIAHQHPRDFLDLHSEVFEAGDFGQAGVEDGLLVRRKPPEDGQRVLQRRKRAGKALADFDQQSGGGIRAGARLAGYSDGSCG